MGVRATCSHKAYITGDSIRVDLVSSSYGGSARVLTGSSGFANLQYDNLDIANVFADPIQKASLTFSFEITSSGDEAIIDELFQAQEGENQLELFINDTLFWKGDVLIDQSMVADGEAYPYSATIVAKDFTSLEGSSFPLENLRQLKITVLGRILSQTGYGRPIHTSTSWVCNGINASNDYLRQVYLDTEGLRDFGKEADAQISYYEALKRILIANQLKLKQANGVFLIEHLSAHESPASVLRTVYNAAGEYQSQSNVNPIKAANTSQLKIVQGSVNEVKPAYKRVDSRYAHRTQVAGIQLPASIQPGFTGPADNLVDDPVTFTQPFVADAETSISLNGVVDIKPLEGFEFNSVNPPIARIAIKCGVYYWNNGAGAWQTTSIINQFPVNSQGQGILSVVTSPVPEFPASTELDIIFYASNVFPPSITRYLYFVMELLNDDQPDIQNAIPYYLQQVAQYSVDFDAGDYMFGDGPTPWSPSALRNGIGVVDLTTEWQRRGTTPDRNYHLHRLKEVLDFYRKPGLILSAQTDAGVILDWSPVNTLSYRSKYFYFIGGGLDCHEGVWSFDVIENTFASGDDLFEVAIITGSALLTAGIYSAIGLSGGKGIEAGSQFPYRLLLPISGVVNRLVVDLVAGDPPILTPGMVLRVLHPISLLPVEFKVLEMPADGSGFISVEEKEIQSVWPAGSPVFVTGKSLVSSLAIGEFRAEFQQELKGVAVLQQPVSGLVSELDIYSFTFLRKGSVVALLNTDINQIFYAKIMESVSLGPVVVPIQPEVIIAPIGTVLQNSERELNALLSVDPGSVLASVEESMDTNSIGRVTQEFLAEIEYSEIELTSISDEVHLYDDQKLYIHRQKREGYDQIGEIIRVDGDQVLVPGTDTLAIKPKIFEQSYPLETPCFVIETGYQVSTSLTLQRDQIVALAQYQDELIDSVAGLELQVGDAIGDIEGLDVDLGIIGARSALFAETNGNLAIVELLSGTVSSFARVKADQVEIGGTTTFLSATYDPSTKETPAGAQDKADAAQAAAESYAVTQRNQARNNIAAQLGYTDYNDMVAEAVAGRTIINGGYLRTELIETAALFAQTVSITGVLTMGTGGLIKGSNDDWSISTTGITIGAGQGSYEQSRAMRIGNRIRIYGVDGNPGVDGAYFEMFENTFMKFDIDGDLIFDVASGKTVSFNRVISNSAAASADNHLLRRIDADGRFYEQSTADSRFVRTTNTNQSVQGIKIWTHRQDFKGDMRVYGSNGTNYATLEYSGGSGNRVVRIPQFANTTVSLVGGDEQDGSVSPNTRLRLYIGSELYYVSAEKFI